MVVVVLLLLLLALIADCRRTAPQNAKASRQVSGVWRRREGGWGQGSSSRPRRRRGGEVDPSDEVAIVVCEVRELLPAVALSP